MTEIQPHNPVYKITHGYGWAADAWKDKRLQDVDDDALTAIIERHLDSDGNLNVYDLVDAAIREDHPLHDFLHAESDEEAAYRWRGTQAQEIPRNTVRLWRNLHTDEVTRDKERAFVSRGIGGNKEHEGVYRLIQVKRPALPEPAPVKQYEIKRTPDQPQPASLPEPKAESAPEPICTQPAPPQAAVNELTERHKKALRTLKTWAESYRGADFFAPIVALIDTYPDPD